MSDQKTEPNASAAARPKRRFRILLGASLALNLLFIGGLVGAIAKGPPSRSGAPGLREISAPYVGAFERDEKRELRRDMRKRLPDRKAAMSRNKADYDVFVALVRADPFDASKAVQVLETQMERAGAFQKLGRELSVEKINQMNVEERNAYADRLEAWLKNRPERRPRKD